MPIQWFPGHMAKAKRQLAERLPFVDLVLEVVDARVPESSRNPDLTALLRGKTRLLVLNKADLADPASTEAWLQALKARGVPAIDYCALTDRREKLTSYIKEIVARPATRRFGATRVLVAGIPNVGKSAVINKLAERRSARVGAHPGVTRGQQWLRVSKDLEILDTPGLLWHKFARQETGLRLAAVGAIRTEVLPVEEVAFWLAGELLRLNPEGLAQAYETKKTEPAEVLQDVARRRGLYLAGGRLDLEGAAALFLRDFQAGKLGRITLEKPGVEEVPV